MVEKENMIEDFRIHTTVVWIARKPQWPVGDGEANYGRYGEQPIPDLGLWMRAQKWIERQLPRFLNKALFGSGIGGGGAEDGIYWYRTCHCVGVFGTE